MTNPSFRQNGGEGVRPELPEGRTPLERFLAERLAYFTECQLATLEDARSRRGLPKYQLARHESIAAQMVEVCNLVDASPVRAPRLRRALEAMRESQ